MNSYDTSYTGPVYLGSPLQGDSATNSDFVYDSGSGFLTVTGNGCTSCSSNLYNPANSTSSKIGYTGYSDTTLKYGSAEL